MNTIIIDFSMTRHSNFAKKSINKHFHKKQENIFNPVCGLVDCNFKPKVLQFFKIGLIFALYSANS